MIYAMINSLRLRAQDAQSKMILLLVADLAIGTSAMKQASGFREPVRSTDEERYKLSFKAEILDATLNRYVPKGLIGKQIDCHVDKKNQLIKAADLPIKQLLGTSITKVSVTVAPEHCKFYDYDAQNSTCKLEMKKHNGQGEIVTDGGKHNSNYLKGEAIKLELELWGISLKEWVQFAMISCVDPVQLCDLTENEVDMLGENKTGTLQCVGRNIYIEAETENGKERFDFSEEAEHTRYPRGTDGSFHHIFCKTITGKKKYGWFGKSEEKRIRLVIKTSNPRLHWAIMYAMHGEDSGAIHEYMKECAQNQDGL